MRLKKSITDNFEWHSPVEFLAKGKTYSNILSNLQKVGVTKISDLLWLIPLRLTKTPKSDAFKNAQLNTFFKGSGKVLRVNLRPAFGRKGRGKLLLYSGEVIVQDHQSSEVLTLKWFNLYPNQKKMIESFNSIHFLGQVQEFKTIKQIVNPQVAEHDLKSSPYIIEYPTINKIPGTKIKKVIDLIPDYLWEDIPETFGEIKTHDQMSLSNAFKIIHGKYPASLYEDTHQDLAIKRIVYEEFLIDQLKILTRRHFIKKENAPIFSINKQMVDDLITKLPFTLTKDQEKSFLDILNDFESGRPMLRMIQGDVGCGKTIISFLAAQVSAQSGHQVALMCPTEALACQHYESFKNLDPKLKIDILLGSTKSKNKKIILQNVLCGETSILIGTHSLFQDSLFFQKLGLVIIDEQHKFGVEQRLRLAAKGKGVHCLIMSATPIPRTLSLAQYGDLDLSFIRTMPAGRKAIKTRITEKVNYQKYIDFIRRRLELGEQAYFVFPAIEESETLEITNVKQSLSVYRETFSEFNVDMLHGQMKADEKDKIIQAFRDNKIHILLSTSVVEVGINIPNATIMSIYNPERFGLSSLHQLRGRVGRGEKPGFCFLVLHKETSPDLLRRLEVIEKNLDGFKIAEEDLKIRGQGDLFGVEQSGTSSSKKFANLISHSDILEQVVADVSVIEHRHPKILMQHLERLAKDQKILNTI